MNEREAAKWLELGYETYGLAGARAIARAMGLRTNEMPATTASRRQRWTAIPGSATLATHEEDDQLPVHRSAPKPTQAPQTPKDSTPSAAATATPAQEA